MSWQGEGDFLERIETRLIAQEREAFAPVGGDLDYYKDQPDPVLRDAAVLFGIVRREQALNVVFTLRPQTMANHPGQISLPGGKRDESDETPIAAALREAEEEIGLPKKDVSVRGVADRYVTATGFCITPVIGLLPDGFTPIPDPHEVEDVFETPVSFLMNPDNHQHQSAFWKGRQRSYLEIDYNGHRIWGVTAGVIRALHDRLYGEGLR